MASIKPVTCQEDIMKAPVESDILNKLVKIFKKYTSIEKVLLFGSRARGDFSKVSDIDIAVFSEDISDRDFNLLIDEINQIDIALSFDVVHYDKLAKASLRNEILKDGVVMYERENH
ncbi:MAG: nucleotidyltransferase domain-containing protein [Tepidanaerobacteraceae bacterium]|jgi:predicted nucleotidyltransferase|nr:nucleotidyltransferase domain-containing protein [Tepidanaerobacteraceae bacterium]